MDLWVGENLLLRVYITIEDLFGWCFGLFLKHVYFCISLVIPGSSLNAIYHPLRSQVHHFFEKKKIIKHKRLGSTDRKKNEINIEPLTSNLPQLLKFEASSM